MNAPQSAADEPRRIETQCCIAGGGPAGMMLGYLLARAGVNVIVLEKHADFLRDFRGDTVHPSTLQAMYDVGVLDRFLSRPHDQIDHLSISIGGKQIEVADLSHLPTHAKFIAIMPQWEFLDFLAEEASRIPQFRLIRNAEAENLLFEEDRVVGVSVRTAGGPMEIRAPLSVAADGRTSVLRRSAGLAVTDLGAPIDVLWMRLPRHPADPVFPLGRIEAGRLLITITRADYFQCAYVVAKGGFDRIQAAGLDAFREDVVRLNPAFADRVEEIRTWADVKLLTVKVDRLERWARGGLLCIGDAAHAMSPIGGVGINLAIQDAVVAANLLWRALLDGRIELSDLTAVQVRREMPTRRMQGLQLFIQNRFIAPTLASNTRPRAPFALKLLGWFPILRRIPARVLGLGFRLDRVRSPDRRTSMNI